MARLLGICGSPRNASTEYVLRKALEAAAEIEGIEIDTIFLRGKKINFCIHCNKCIKEDKRFCTLHKDDMMQFYERFYAADAYLIASPVYEMNITAQLAAFFNRFRPAYLLKRRDPDFFSGKLGSAIAVGGTRNGGQEMAINAIHGFYHTQGISIVNGGLGCYGGAAVWSQDREAVGAAEDTVGMKNVLSIARKLARKAVECTSVAGAQG
jgi:multimeric flavodoxin WrbA